MDLSPPFSASELSSNSSRIGQDIAATNLIIPDLPSAQPLESALLRIEAEDMVLEGYRLESIDFASNRTVASFWGESKRETGRATTKFLGAGGTYDIILGYFDEEGGGATLDPLLNGQSLGKLKLDQKLGSSLPTLDNLVRRTVGQRVTLQTGDTFAVAGTEDANEHARFDYVEFVQVPKQDSGFIRPLSEGAKVRYIIPGGKGDGSSWDNPASLNDLDRLIEQSSGGDEIWLAGDCGTYDMSNRTIKLDSGSRSDKPVYIRGVASEKGGKSTPLFVGDRAENWKAGKSDGGQVFRLLKGANNLHFSDLNFKNIGNGAFLLGGDLSNITLERMEVDNARRFVENDAKDGARTASVDGLTIRDVEIRGFSKSAIRLQYNTNDVLIEDVFGDSERQDGDAFAMGVHLAGSVHDVVHRRVTMNNATQRKGNNDYWNADGFVTDWGTYDITYEDTFASGSTDGGYDLKSKDTLLIRAAAANNKRNFRIWRNAMMIDVISDEPFSRGGTGTTAHVHVLGDGGNVTIKGGTFSGDENIDNIIFDLDDRGRLKVESATITDNRYQLRTVSRNARIELNNLKQS